MNQPLSPSQPLPKCWATKLRPRGTHLAQMGVFPQAWTRLSHDFWPSFHVQFILHGLWSDGWQGGLPLTAYLGYQKGSRATLRSIETFHYSRNPGSWIPEVKNGLPRWLSSKESSCNAGGFFTAEPLKKPSCSSTKVLSQGKWGTNHASLGRSSLSKDGPHVVIHTPWAQVPLGAGLAISNPGEAAGRGHGQSSCLWNLSHSK